MAVDERARHALHVRLDEVLGPEVTGTLMELLPPVGWADVATRQDLDALGHRMDARLADLRTELHSELGKLRTEMMANQRQVMFGLFGAIAANAGVVWAALTFAG